jgi:hypothetical protein
VQAAPFFEATLLENGWDEEHPTFQRMYLGNWSWDPSAMCFPFLQSRNGIAALPERSLAGGPLPKHQWRFVIGADVAGLGVTAIAILAAHPGDPRTFVWSTENHNAWLPEQLVERVRAIKADQTHGYDMRQAVLIVDTGGLGSVHNLHLTRKAGDLYHEEADKLDKKSWIREIHDEMLAGRMVWLDGERNRAAFDEMAVLEWDELHEKWIKGPPDHATDATGYAKRRIAQYVNAATKADNADAETLLERESERLKARHMGRMRPAANGRAAWDR